MGRGGETAKVMLGTSLCAGKAYCEAFLKQVVEGIEGVSHWFLACDDYPVPGIWDWRSCVMGPFEPEPDPWSKMMQRITRVRETIRQEFLETDCTHLYFHDCDMAPPRGIVPALLKHKLPVVTGCYPVRDITVPLAPAYVDEVKQPHGNVVLMAETEAFRESKLLVEVRGFGMGCMLIDRRSLEETPFRTPEAIRKHSIGEDYAWCVDSGHMCKVDLEQRAWHIGESGFGTRVVFGGLKPETLWTGYPEIVTNRHGSWTRGVPKYDLPIETVVSLPPGFVTRTAREVVIQRESVWDIVGIDSLIH